MYFNRGKNSLKEASASSSFHRLLALSECVKNTDKNIQLAASASPYRSCVANECRGSSKDTSFR